LVISAHHRGEQRAAVPRTAQLLGLQFVHQRALELMMVADVIGVGVGRDCRHRLVEQMLSGFAQAGNAHAGVDHQVPVAPAHVPDVAAHERHHMRLPQQRDVVAHLAGLEPAVGDRQHLDILEVWRSRR
jgi:hypothetical protein